MTTHSASVSKSNSRTLHKSAPLLSKASVNKSQHASAPTQNSFPLGGLASRSATSNESNLPSCTTVVMYDPNAVLSRRVALPTSSELAIVPFMNRSVGSNTTDLALVANNPQNQKVTLKSDGTPNNNQAKQVQLTENLGPALLAPLAVPNQGIPAISPNQDVSPRATPLKKTGVNNTHAHSKTGATSQFFEDAEASSINPHDARVLMDQLAADGRKDAIQAAELAAQASRTEALAKNMKKGADAGKNLT